MGGGINKSKYGNPYVSNIWSEKSDLDIEELLDQLRREHGFKYRIRLLSNEYTIEKFKEYTIEHYGSENIVKEFLPSAPRLEKRKRGGFEKDFYDRRNKTHTFYNAVVIKVNREIEWYEQTPYNIICLLVFLLDEGVKSIEGLLTDKEWPAWEEPFIPKKMKFKGTSHIGNYLLRKLIISGKLGSFTRTPDTEFPVGKHVHYGVYDWWPLGMREKYIDMVYETKNEIWIIEAKIVLDWTAIGQVLGYKILFNKKRRQLPEKERTKPIKLLIVCEYIDPEINNCCRELGILVWPSSELEK